MDCSARRAALGNLGRIALLAGILCGVSFLSQAAAAPQATGANPVTGSTPEESNQAIPQGRKLPAPLPPQAGYAREQSDAGRNIERRLRELEVKNGSATVLWTAILAAIGFFQLLLFSWQLYLMRETVKDSGLAAKAAELNARAAIGIELPVIRFVFADLLHTSGPIPDEGPYSGTAGHGPPTQYSAVGNFYVRNLGRTPAFPEGLSVGWQVATALTGEPAYTRIKRVSHSSVIHADPENEFLVDLHISIELTQQQQQEISSETKWLWLYGLLSYRDFMGERREARFCWRYANRNVGTVVYHWDSDGDPPETYTRNV